jgi:hypothetical protein
MQGIKGTTMTNPNERMMREKKAPGKEARKGRGRGRGLRPFPHGGWGRALCAGLGLAAFCLYGCKTRPDPGAPDLHQPQNNPLVGVWQEEDSGDYYFFREDGTGGIAGTPDAAPDYYSFLFWQSRGLGVAASKGTNHLATIGGDTSEASLAEVRRYTFVEHDGALTLTSQEGAPLRLVRIEGAGVPLSLDNPFMGEWLAAWDGTHGDESAWSFKFREDGTVRTYHHGMHQFDNAYLVRGNVMALLGEWRFDGAFDLKYMTFSVNGEGDGIAAQEEPADNAPGLSWVFKRVSAAEWK